MTNDAPTGRKWLRFRRRKGALRSAPGTVVSRTDSPPPQLHVIAFGPEDLDEADITSPDEVVPYLSKYNVTWLNVDGVGDAKIIKQIGELFQFHPLALEDVANLGQRPKVEEYDDHLFVVSHMMSDVVGEHSEQLGIFFGKNYVVTFQERPGQDTFASVRSRIRKNRGRVRGLGADYLAYALLDSVVDGYFPVLEKLSDRIDDIEMHVGRATGGQVIREIQSVRNELLQVRRAVWPLRDAIGTLVRDDHVMIKPPTRIFLRDCYDHCVQLIDLAEIQRELCSDLRDYLLTIVSQKTNDVMRVLTIIATIFIPLGFIAGLYGMNFDAEKSKWNMPELKWAFGYPFALGLMAIVAGSLVFFFHRRGWIGTQEWDTDRVNQPDQPTATPSTGTEAKT